jgi:hypothetical protein
MPEDSEAEGKIAGAKDSNRSNGGIPAGDAQNVADGVRTSGNKASLYGDVCVKIDAPRGSGDLAGEAREPKASFFIGDDGKFFLVGEQGRRDRAQPALANGRTRSRDQCGCPGCAAENIHDLGWRRVCNGIPLLTSARIETWVKPR